MQANPSSKTRLEKELQNELLKYAPLVKKYAAMYVRRNRGLESYFDDMMQEGWVSMMLNKTTFITTRPRAGIREYLRRFHGIAIDKNRPKRTYVFNPVKIQDILLSRNSQNNDESGELIEAATEEQPDYSRKDLYEKVKKLAEELLTETQFSAVFVDDDEFLQEERNRRKASRCQGINKLRDHIQRNWK